MCRLNLMAWKASWAHRTRKNKKKRDIDKIKNRSERRAPVVHPLSFECFPNLKETNFCIFHWTSVTMMVPKRSYSIEFVGAVISFVALCIGIQLMVFFCSSFLVRSLNIDTLLMSSPCHCFIRDGNNWSILCLRECSLVRKRFILRTMHTEKLNLSNSSRY